MLLAVAQLGWRCEVDAVYCDCMRLFSKWGFWLVDRAVYQVPSFDVVNYLLHVSCRLANRSFGVLCASVAEAADRPNTVGSCHVSPC